jgi:ABC-type polysaccharide/polyol phosphate transport system ATPase subunit
MSSEKSAIDLEHVTKLYRIGVGRARVREMIPNPFDRQLSRLFSRWWYRDTFNALDDISVTVSRGSSVGIVGHNGAGKTTLLKVIAGITEPSGGQVKVEGRAAALIDVLVGFHPDLTGRENLFLLAGIYGFKRKASSRLIGRILEFAEIEGLADTPLKRYSTGMTARLGFAALTALDVDILLIDEVLAVGDASFQRKCVRWLDEYRGQGGTFVFVSHNLALVRNMTDRVLWLDHGRIRDDGSPRTVLSKYGQAMEHRDETTARHTVTNTAKSMIGRGLHRWGAGGMRIYEVHIDTGPATHHETDFRIAYESRRPELARFAVGFIDESEREVGASISPAMSVQSGNGAIQCTMRELPLRPGIYFPVVAVTSSEGIIQDRWRLDRAVVIEADGNDMFEGSLGSVELAAEWSGSLGTPSVRPVHGLRAVAEQQEG